MQRPLKLFIILSLLLSGGTAAAGVRFLVEKGQETQYHDAFTPPSSDYAGPSSLNLCEKNGYIHTSCAPGLALRNRCPYDNRYYAECCPEDYRYSAAQCQSMGKKAGAYACAGLYACY